MVRKAKIDYDKENDILYVYSGEKVKDSLEVDNFVLDFSYDNKVVGVEIFNASKILSKLALIKISKNILSKIIDATISFYQSRDIFFVIVGLVLIIGKKRREIPVQVPAPRVAVSIK